MHFMGSSTIPMHRANGWYIIGAAQSLLLLLQEVSNSSCQTLMLLYHVTHHNTAELQKDKKLATSQIFRVICQKFLFIFIHLPVTLLHFFFPSLLLKYCYLSLKQFVHHFPPTFLL